MLVKKLDQNNFLEYIKEGAKPAIVEFWAPWCVYCRRIGSAFEKIADQYGEEILVAQVNIDEEPELEAQFQIEVIPTLLFFQDGQVTGKIVAPDSKAKIEAFIKEQRG